MTRCWCCGRSRDDGYWMVLLPDGDTTRAICVQCGPHVELTRADLILPMRCPQSQKPPLHIVKETDELR